LPRTLEFIQAALVYPQDPAPADGPDAFKLYQLIDDLAADAQIAGGFRNGHERFQTFLRSIQIGHEHLSLRFLNRKSNRIIKKTAFFTVEDSLQLAAAIFNSFLITLSGYASGLETAPEILTIHNPR
jgi:hypothetical protein